MDIYRFFVCYSETLVLTCNCFLKSELNKKLRRYEVLSIYYEGH